MVYHDITKISWEEKEELKRKLEKMEEEEEEENSPSIAVFAILFLQLERQHHRCAFNYQDCMGNQEAREDCGQGWLQDVEVPFLWDRVVLIE